MVAAIGTSFSAVVKSQEVRFKGPIRIREMEMERVDPLHDF
jgi:hypothetical protein